ncbi:amidohydrolase family protein [Melittangium boletus]|uniref:Amidohydrolase n=1 Tax=Melittangium boletus DSM 14713 TaxID=1294270 RepID=A0A250IEJ4_9BACT|nr:amidohydrolase family protein [Melittangium boletus]ATB29582.1 amidohydrolase [Melittangium boletus DSM 14713]
MIIDIHSHLAHPELAKRAPVPPSLLDVERLIEVKAEAGIDLTLIGSPSGPGTLVPASRGGNYEQPLDKLRAFHDWLGATVAKHRDRLRAYVYCDPFADDTVLAAAEEYLGREEFVGIITNPSGHGEYLDSPRADGFFAFAATRGVPVMVHSGMDPVCCQGISDYGLFDMVGRYCDVTLGLSALVLSGRLEQYPSLRIIGTASAGALSLIGSRLDIAWRSQLWAGAGKKPEGLRDQRTRTPPSELIRRLYADTTADNRDLHLANLKVLGASHLLFGSDWPPVPVVHAHKIREIEALPLSAEEQRAILGDNASRIFELGGPAHRSTVMTHSQPIEEAR